MADDDETGEDTGSSDPIQPVQRRSTYTPPEAGDGSHDDDALADALAAEFARIASGPIPIVQPGQYEMSEPTDADQEPPEPAYEPAAAYEPPAAEEPFAAHGPPPAYEPPAPAEPAPDDAAATQEPAPPAWMNAPAPDPAQAVDLPEGPPERPVRRSLPDDQLAGWVDEAGKEPGGTLNLIEGLESQLRLREEEAREFTAWEQTMRTLGTPDAISEVEEARPEFTGVLPDLGAAVGGTPAEPEAFTPEPEAEPPSPPSYDISPEELYRPPTGWFIPEPPPTDQDAPAAADVQDVAAPESDVPFGPTTGAFILPEEPLAAWPAPHWDEPDDAAPVADDDLETGDLPRAPTVWSLDGTEAAQVEDVAPPAPEEPVAPEIPAEEESFFLPEPTYEPLHPTHPIETIERGERVDPTESSAAEAAASAAAAAVISELAAAGPEAGASPFAPPPLIEPPVPYGEVVEAEAIPEAMPEAPIFHAVDDGVFVDPAPEIGQEDGFPLGEEFFPAKDLAAAPSSFDDLLAGTPDEGELVGVAPEPLPRLDAETLFIEPLPAAAGELPVTTGSITIIDQAYQEEIDEDIDETDRVVQDFGPVSVDTAGIAIVPPPISPPSGPISTVRIREDEQVLAGQPKRMSVFSLEASGDEPTPEEFRVGRAARMFWLWFAANSSILSFGLGAAVFSLGLSFSQSVVAILIGVALSFIPLGLTTFAGKRSGQPTMVVSRATFGLLGNIVPAIVALVSRLFWGGVLLWFLATSVAIVLVGAELNGSLSERQLLLVGLAGGFAIAVLIAVFGYALLAKIQLVLTIVSAILVIGLIALTAQYVDVQQAINATPNGPWELVVGGAVLVFSFVGLVWANSGGDLARYQNSESSGAFGMLWATFGMGVPSFVLIAWGALLAASNEGIASGFLLSPLDTLALMLPSWYPVPLLAATVLSLLSGITISLYSGGFALKAIGVRVTRAWSVAIVAVLLAGVTLVITFAVPGGTLELFRDAATTLAVPVAAWAGIFAAEMMIRNRRFEERSLLVRGGVYRDVRWFNLIAFLLITVIGYGLTTATVTWLSWQGYFFGVIGASTDSDLAATDLGVVVALGLGLLVTFVVGVPGIRKQEATEV